MPDFSVRPWFPTTEFKHKLDLRSPRSCYKSLGLLLKRPTTTGLLPRRVKSIIITRRSFGSSGRRWTISRFPVEGEPIKRAPSLCLGAIVSSPKSYLTMKRTWVRPTQRSFVIWETASHGLNRKYAGPIKRTICIVTWREGHISY